MKKQKLAATAARVGFKKRGMWGSSELTEAVQGGAPPQVLPSRVRMICLHAQCGTALWLSEDVLLLIACKHPEASMAGIPDAGWLYSVCNGCIYDSAAGRALPCVFFLTSLLPFSQATGEVRDARAPGLATVQEDAAGDAQAGGWQLAGRGGGRRPPRHPGGRRQQHGGAGTDAAWRTQADGRRAVPNVEPSGAQLRAVVRHCCAPWTSCRHAGACP